MAETNNRPSDLSAVEKALEEQQRAERTELNEDLVHERTIDERITEALGQPKDIDPTAP